MIFSLRPGARLFLFVSGGGLFLGLFVAALLVSTPKGRTGVNRFLALLVLSSILAVGAGALAFGLPLGAAAAGGLARTVAALLNFTIGSGSIPARVFLVEAFAGLAVPLAVSLIPVARSSP
jgi:hypothetical protein